VSYGLVYPFYSWDAQAFACVSMLFVIKKHWCITESLIFTTPALESRDLICQNHGTQSWARQKSRSNILTMFFFFFLVFFFVFCNNTFWYISLRLTNTCHFLQRLVASKKWTDVFKMSFWGSGYVRDMHLLQRRCITCYFTGSNP
jgi:choline-glycine betaine transporter